MYYLILTIWTYIWTPGEGNFVAYDDSSYLVNEDYEGDEEDGEFRPTEMIEPSRFGRTRWANPKYMWRTIYLKLYLYSEPLVRDFLLRAENEVARDTSK